ncbi:MAG: hydrogenase formation protein HypD, partial [Halanaeroarchaeum sp.]
MTDEEEPILRFRDDEQAAALYDRIDALMDAIGEPVSLMHVCGSHEEAIAKYGLRHNLPSDLSVRMGPGCPVCVTDMPEIDEGIALAEAGVTVATFGDMFRVPGTEGSLRDAKRNGANVEVVYSAADAVEYAADNPEESVVFFATGFETTAAPTAAVLAAEPPENFSVLSVHKYVPPAMEVLTEMPETNIDGFLAAGHAAAITGYGLFEDLVDESGIPTVVGGFEPLDVLRAIADLLEMIATDDPGLGNAYPRVVSEAGNVAAQETMWSVFERTTRAWRGLGEIPSGNLAIRPEYAAYDAREQYDIDPDVGPVDPVAKQCRCGDIMAGTADPDDCTLFGTVCTPRDPVGPCMVSDEGTCNIWNRYGGRPEV